MANRKITEFVSLTQPAGDDVFPIVDVSEALDVDKNKKITVAEIFKSIPSGSAAAPGIAFEGNDSVGIYRPGTDQLAISTGGTGRLFVDASGNVGIGTGSPAAALHLAGTATQRFTNTANTSGFDIGLLGGSADINAYIYNRGNGAFVVGTNNVERLRITNTGTLNFTTGGSVTAVSFNGSAPVNSLVIDSTGKVGLGTSSPSTLLTVQGDGTFRVSSGNVGIGLATGSLSGSWYLNDADDSLRWYSSTGGDRLTISSSGNVGIGTTSPAKQLHVEATSSDVTLRIGRNGYVQTDLIGSTGAGANDFKITQNGFDRFVIEYGGNSAARIDSSGRLLVGTSTGRSVYGSNAQVQLEGTTYPTTAFNLIANSNANSGTAPYVQFARSRGTANGSNTIVQAGDRLGGIAWCGANGSNLDTPAAAIEGLVDTGTPSATSMPGRIVLSTTADGAGSVTERMRITSAGNVGINSTLSGNANNQVLIRKNSNSAIVDALLLNNGNADNNAGTGVRINFSGVSEANSHLRYAYIESATTSSGNDHYLAFGTNSAAAAPVERLRITSAGNVGIGTTSASKFGSNKAVTVNGTDAAVELATGDVLKSIFYTNGTDTVVGNQVAGALRFNTNATERLRITSAGNVGIGTTTPQSIFHIGAAAPANSGVKAYTGLANSYEGFLFDYYYNTAANNRRVFDIVALGAGAAGAIGGSDIRFLVNPASAVGTPQEALRITSAGNVGIGTTSPGAPLDVNGAIYSRSTGVYTDTITSYTGSSISVNAGSSNINFIVNASERARIDSSGRLGLGTSSPSSYDFNGPVVLAAANTAGSSTISVISDAASLGQLAFADGTTGTTRYRGLLEYNHSTDAFQIRTAGAPAVTIDSSQRVGIGTTSPTTPFQLSSGSSGSLGRFSTSAGSGELTLDIGFGNSYFHSLGYEVATGNGFLSTNLAGTSIAFRPSGTERARIDSSGRLGLGTSSPGVRLHVQDSIAGGSDGTVATLHNFSDTGADTRYVGLNFRIGSDNGTSAIRAHRTNSVNNYETNLSFWTNPVGATQTPVRAMTIDSYQRVGIGTTSPASALHVVGTWSFIGNSATGSYSTWQHNGVSVGDIGTANQVMAGGANTDFGITTRGSTALTFGTATNERARIDSSGRLLVGTSTSIANLYHASTASVRPLLQLQTATNDYNNGASYLNYSASGFAPVVTLGLSKSNTAGINTVVAANDELGYLQFVGNDGTKFSTAAWIAAFADGEFNTSGDTTDSPGRLVFSTTADGASSPTERMRIGNAGVINTYCASGDSLNVRNAAAAGTATGLIYGLHSATSTANGTTSFVVWTNGNVVNTNNSYGAISDIKLKENIVDANSQWSDIKALQVRNYNFKEGQTHTQIGLIAQEVELVSPGLVNESPDRDTEGNDLGTVTKSVNYSVLYMKAVKALQEAMERIEALEAKVAALEGN